MEKHNLNLRKAKIARELEALESREQKALTKQGQRHTTVPSIALIGYTNAGKTALLNMCAGVKLPSENKLFETLDTTQRHVHLKETNQHAVMMDTVGFITNLPHALVASFRATLAQVHQADVLVHVRDISHPHSDF